MAFPSFVINFLQGFSLHFYSKILLKMDVFLSKCGHCGGVPPFCVVLGNAGYSIIGEFSFLFRCCRKLWTTSFFCFDAIPSVSRRRTRILRSSPSIWWRSTSFLRAVDLFVCLFFFPFFPPPKFFPISVCGPRPMPRPLSDKRKRKRKAKEKKKGNYLRCTRSASRGR